MPKIAPAAQAQERYLEYLQNECAREIQLIDDLLDLQQLEAASYSNSHEVVDLKEWLPSIIRPFRVQARNTSRDARAL